MTDSDKIIMEINIAGERLQLSVPFSSQGLVRDIERSIADLYNNWRRKFADKADREILVMIAYQYASHYHELLQRHRRAFDIVSDCSRMVGSMLDPDSASPLRHASSESEK